MITYVPQEQEINITSVALCVWLSFCPAATVANSDTSVNILSEEHLNGAIVHPIDEAKPNFLRIEIIH